MIFDNDYVSDLVSQWQKTKDANVLDLIIDQSRSLIEVIVSSYDTMHREDLIQESAMRLQYALPFFDPTISNLHNYFTTVIKNICLTYLRKQNRYALEYSLDAVVFETQKFSTKHDEPDDILSILIERNRRRFPSIPVEVIDDITEYVYNSLTCENKRKDIIDGISNIFDCQKTIATTIYYSVLLYLRCTYKDCSIAQRQDIELEFSIIPDINELFGEKIGGMLATVLSGVYVKFP